MKLRKKDIKLIFALIGLLVFIWQTIQTATPNNYFPTKASALQPLEPKQYETAKVTKVVDGDTIEIEGGQKVRFIGVDTPETKHPQKGVECFGKEAFEENKRLLEGKTILLSKDVSNTDRYGRLLRFIYLPNPQATEEALFVNKYMVEEGFAFNSTFPPDVSLSQLFRDSEVLARDLNKGLWSQCKN